jgi:hypothetical protein
MRRLRWCNAISLSSRVSYLTRKSKIVSSVYFLGSNFEEFTGCDFFFFTLYPVYWEGLWDASVAAESLGQLWVCQRRIAWAYPLRGYPITSRCVFHPRHAPCRTPAQLSSWATSPPWRGFFLLKLNCTFLQCKQGIQIKPVVASWHRALHVVRCYLR